MTIKKSLIALKDYIRQNFPKVDGSQSNSKIQAIQIMQELLAEVLLQIERVLEQESLPERFENGSDEQKKALASLAQFCMAISLTGKNRIVAGTFFDSLLDQKSYSSLNSILKNVYVAIAYLDPRIKLCADTFKEGSSEHFPCHDLKMNLHRSFKSSLAIRVAGDEIYFGEIHEIIQELDNYYQNYSFTRAGSQPPLHLPKKSFTPTPNVNFSPQTDNLFAGKLIAAGTDKKKSLEQPSSSTEISNANLSFNDSPKDTVEESLETLSNPTKCNRSNSSANGSIKKTVSFITITRGGLFSMPTHRIFRIEKQKEKEKYTTPPPVIFTKRTP